MYEKTILLFHSVVYLIFSFILILNPDYGIKMSFNSIDNSSHKIFARSYGGALLTISILGLFSIIHNSNLIIKICLLSWIPYHLIPIYSTIKKKIPDLNDLWKWHSFLILLILVGIINI